MIQPGSFLWKALEFYGTRIHHRGQWRVHPWLRAKLGINYSGNLQVERQGLQWILDPSDFVQSWLYWMGGFEYWDWHHFSQFVHAGSTVLDIGANFGYYSIRVASRLAGTGKVFAFEPSPRTFSRLQENIALNRMNSTITAVPMGLSDQQGSGFLTTDATNSGAAFIGPSGDPVVVTTLDHFCRTHAVGRVDLMKIDVEGHELRVIEGAQATIEAHFPALMIEFNESALVRAGSSSAELERQLRSWGYRLFIAHRRELFPLTQLPGAAEIVNVFALHRQE